MTDPVDVLFRTHSNPVTGGYGGAAGLYVGAAPLGTDPKFFSKTVPDLIWVLVLDRTDLTKPPVFNAVLPNNTDIPTELTQALTSKHILFVSISAGILKVPQGDLYKTLMQNGAGGKLNKLEKLSTGFACGVAGNMYYMLVSIPKSNVAGIEIGDVSGFGYGIPDENWSQTAPAANIFMTMAPGPDGYTPVLVD